MEVMSRSSVPRLFAVGCLLIIQVETSISQLNTQVWNSGERSGLPRHVWQPSANGYYGTSLDLMSISQDRASKEKMTEDTPTLEYGQKQSHKTQKVKKGYFSYTCEFVGYRVRLVSVLLIRGVS